MSKIIGGVAGILLSVFFLLAPGTAHSAHPKPGEFGARNMQFNPSMLGIPLLDYFSAAPIIAAGAPVNGRYVGLSPFSTRSSCNLCHYDIVANENMNRHATMSFSKITQSQYGYGYDKEKPWVSGPGKFGKWSPAYNRQLGNMNTTYTNEADLLKKLDMGAFEFTTECGVCHVGGGPGTSNPYGFTFPWRVSRLTINSNGSLVVTDGGPGGIHSNLDKTERNMSIAYDYLFPLPLSSPYYPRRVPLNPWDFFVALNGSVKEVDWAMWGSNGTLQMDCLMCHLEGYDHLARNQEITAYQRLYNAGTLGSGIAVMDPLLGDGSNMSYDATQVKVGSDGALYLDTSFTDRISRIPKAANCVHCHMPTAVKNQAGVADWKQKFYSYDAVPSGNSADPGNIKPPRYLSDHVKRGDLWNQDEIHKALECAGCHSQTGKFQAWKPSDPNYMHSPGKGYDPMVSGSDEFGGTVKFCYDCHILGGDLNGDGVRETDNFSAPLPNSAHAAAGLLYNIVPNAKRIDAQGAEVDFTGNHLDVISCTACHIRKRYSAARSIDYSTGNQYFNFVGSRLDEERGATDIDLVYTWKETTPVKLLPNGQPNPLWRRLIYPFNYVTGIYWNNIGSKDANGDGFTTGMSNNGKIVSGDPFFQRNVKDNFVYGVNADNNRIATGIKGSSVFDTQSVRNADGSFAFTRPAEIEAYKSVVTGKDAGFVPQLVLESEPYLIMHDVAPTMMFVIGKSTVDSNGKKAYGCPDCHGASGGLFNGRINMLGKGKRSDNTEIPFSVAWNGTSDVLTKALYWDKTGAQRSLSFSDTTVSPKTTREPYRWEFLGYNQAQLATLNAPQDPTAYGFDVDPKAVINPIADASPSVSGVQAIVGTPVSLSCPPAQYIDANNNGVYDTGERIVGSTSYSWSNSDGLAMTGATTQNASVTFTTTGAKTITLQVKDEEGNTRTAYASLTVIPPPISMSWDAVNDIGTFGNFPSGTTSVKVDWGDGLQNSRSGIYLTDPLSIKHVYSSTTTKTIKINCYNSSGAQIGSNSISIKP